MGNYLDLFPKIQYTLEGNDSQYPNYTTITDITYRIGMIKEVLTNFAAYTEYTVKEGETPEQLANRFYGDPEAYWIILYANNIYDANYGWPLSYKEFNAFIVSKYGSNETAQTTFHHYEKVITRENITDKVTTVTRFKVNQTAIATGGMSVDLPYDTYASLEYSYTAPTEPVVIDGKSIIEVVSRNRVTNYDYESELNETKRNIKVIKNSYYPQLISEFDKLTKNIRNASMRRLT